MKNILLVTALFLLTGCQSKQQLDPGDELIWSDEFNYEGAPDSAKWTYDIGHGWHGWGNNEMQYYTDAAENVRVTGGRLHIEARRDSSGSWTSARIKSEGKQSFTYGRIEFRARLPKGVGTWPALWMLGDNIKEVSWPACGEIDIMEYVGKNHGQVHSSLHTPSSYANTVNTNFAAVLHPDTLFHTYQALWTPDSIRFSVDEVPFYTYAPERQNPETWPFDKPFHLIINLAMGGNWGSADSLETNELQNGIDPALLRAVLEVDYVRVYDHSRKGK